MDSARLKENLTTVENSTFPMPKPIPINTTYSNHQILTPVQSSKDSYTYVTPYIKYFTETKNDELFIYLLTKSQKHIIKKIYGKIVKIIVFKPRKNVMHENIKGCLLVASTNQILVLGIKVESDYVSLVNTGIEVAITDEILDVVASTEGAIAFSTNYGFYELCYFYGFFSTNFVHKLSSFKKKITELIWKEKIEINAICIGKKYSCVLRDDKVEIYTVGTKSKFLKEIYVEPACGIHFYDENIFFIVQKFGRRVFYNINGRVSSVELSQEMSYYDGDVKIVCKDDLFCYLRKKKNSSSCVLIVVSQNQYYKGGNSGRENYQTLHFNEDIINCVICDREIICSSKNNTFRTRVIPTHEYLLNCRQDEIKKLYALFGSSGFMINYLYMIENNMDTSKIEFLFLKTEDYSFIYKYIYNILAQYELYGKKVVQNFERDELHQEEFLFNLKHRKLVELATVYSALKDIHDKLWRYRKVGLREAISDLKIVMNTVLFIKIVKERHLDIEYSFKDLLFNQSHREKVFSDISNAIGYERANEIFAKKLRDYFPIEQIHFQRGLQNVKRKRKEALYDSLVDFKECRNFDETLKVYNESKFYTGCVILIRDCIYDVPEIELSKRRRFNDDVDVTRRNKGYVYYLEVLMKNMMCRGALNKALEDVREEFIYTVLEAYLRNLIKGVPLTKDCLCCDRTDDTFYYNNSVDLIFVKSPFLLPFLEEKAALSSNKDQFVLLWKYHMWKKDRVLAQKYLLKVIQTKPMSFSRRMELLLLCANIDSAPYIKSIYEAAKIQNELIKLEPENAFIKSRLIDPNELFNVYLHPTYELLSLKMMMITEYEDINLKRMLFDKLLSNDYTNNIEKLGFLKDLNKNDWVEIEIVGDVLVRSLERNNYVSMVTVLINFGYSEVDIKKYMETRIRGTVFMNPEIKRRILNEFLNYYGKEDYTSIEVKKYCYDNFGIKL